LKTTLPSGARRSSMNKIENYALGQKPDDVILHRVIGGSFVGENSDPPLSIKCMFGGTATYILDGRQHHRIDDSCFLLLNKGHDYIIEKKAAKPMETFCVFLPAELVPAVAHQCTSTDDELLDLPEDRWPQFNDFEHRRPHGSAVSQRVLTVRSMLMSGQLDDASLEEALYFLAIDIVSEHRGIQKRIANQSQARMTTRLELYRRIHISRDYMHAHLREPQPLLETARAASLSPFHFLRSFRQIIGETPRRYLQRVRINHAKFLLHKTNLSISEVAFQVGYQSLPSFSSLFRTHTGASPSQYRLART